MEVPVRPEIWSGIQSSMNAGISSAAAAKTSLSLVSKVAIAITSVAVTAGTIVYFTSGDQDKTAKSSTENTLRTETVPENSEETEQQKLNEPEQQAELSKSILSIDNAPEKINKEGNNKIADTGSEDIADWEENKEKGIKETINTDSVLPAKNKNTEMTVSKEHAPKEMGRDQKQTTVEVKEKQNNNTVQEQKSAPAEKGKVQAWQRTNVFSPNNDGINDLFFLENSNLKEFSISVLNEKNQVVYQSQDPNFKWDGTDYRTGEIIPAGNYSYIIFAVDMNGEIIKQFNILTISR